MSTLLGWLAAHESALSAIAAMMAITAGIVVVFSPMGAGLRGLLSRENKIESGSADAPTANTTPVVTQDFLDTPPPLITDKPSIAVLPFVNMSSDSEQEFFADGMTEDIITGLSCDNRLFVIARNSTFAYKGQSPDIRAVGKELGVHYVLEGSIRPVGDRLRITVQLIETASGAHVWADKIDRPVAEIFDIMDDVVDGLVMTLCSNLGIAESKRAQRTRPEDLRAWALCVQAETLYFAQPGPDSMTAAEDLLRRATDIEPGYAASWGLLALMVSLRPVFGVSADPAKDTEQAMLLANKAINLAPQDPLVLGYSGVALTWAGQTAQAVDCLERSLEMNPNSSVFRLYYGATLLCDARPAAGIEQLELFFRLSPKDPNAGMAYFFYAYCCLVLDDFSQAEQLACKTVKLIPSFPWAHMALATSLKALGRDTEAQPHIQKARELAPGWTLSALDDFWQLVIRTPEHAAKFSTLTHQAWED
ncbi:MAG: hypothetical protein V7717_06250 [Porticoccaceae bacterium]